MTFQDPRGLNGGSFQLEWGEVHSSWGSLDQMLHIQSIIGGTIASSADYKAPYGVHVFYQDEQYVMLFASRADVLLDVVNKLHSREWQRQRGRP